MHRLAQQIALRTAAVLLPLWLVLVARDVMGLDVMGLGGVPWWAALVLALATAAAAYGVALRLLRPRLALAHDTLQQIQERRFENLDAADLPDGDELNALVHQVYRTGQTLEQEIAALKRIESYRREFLGNVSHELKTPIFAIRGFAETLQDGALEDPTVSRRFLGKIIRNTTRLTTLTQDLAEISKIEMGELKMTMAPFAFQRLARDVCESLEPLAAEAAVTLSARVPDALGPVVGDSDRIRQVLVNLIQNAIKYNQPGGHVELVARPLPEGEVKVSVVDNGIGIAPEHLPRLTERFFRIDKSRSRMQGGTGLGLAIVKHILQAHGQALKIESIPGGGSTFGFHLAALPEPDARADASADARADASADARADARPDGRADTGPVLG